MDSSHLIEKLPHSCVDKFPTSVTSKTFDLLVELTFNEGKEVLDPVGGLGLLREEVHPHVPCCIVHECEHVPMLATDGGFFHGTNEIRVDEIKRRTRVRGMRRKSMTMHLANKTPFTSWLLRERAYDVDSVG
jgi:hypothetical protein